MIFVDRFRYFIFPSVPSLNIEAKIESNGTFADWNADASLEDWPIEDRVEDFDED